MTPGSVAMLLGETTGLRVQTIAPSIGAANVRIQGLRGRYAQVLADGLPLFGAGGDSLNLLQVPPLDLGQVEVIKGAASALYGPAALGGVINLVSRRPAEAETERARQRHLAGRPGRHRLRRRRADTRLGMDPPRRLPRRPPPGSRRRRLGRSAGVRARRRAAADPTRIGDRHRHLRDRRRDRRGSRGRYAPRGGGAGWAALRADGRHAARRRRCRRPLARRAARRQRPRLLRAQRPEPRLRRRRRARRAPDRLRRGDGHRRRGAPHARRRRRLPAGSLRRRWRPRSLRLRVQRAGGVRPGSRSRSARGPRCPRASASTRTASTARS